MIKDIIKNKDIRAIQAKFNKLGRLSPQEARLLSEASMSESQIQIACNNLVNYLDNKNVVFQQNDNGGKMGVGLRMKKKAEGTISGWFDVTLWIFKDGKVKVIFIEFKKINGKPTEEQLFWHNFMKERGQSVHFCNNTVYFEEVILREVKEFLAN